MSVCNACVISDNFCELKVNFATVLLRLILILLVNVRIFKCASDSYIVYTLYLSYLCVHKHYFLIDILRPRIVNVFNNVHILIYKTFKLYFIQLNIYDKSVFKSYLL